MVAAAEDDKITWYNYVNDHLTQGTVIPSAVNGVRSIATADMDNDSDTDVLSASFYDFSIRWHENDGSGDFTEHHVVFDEANGPIAVAAADVDNDGNMDVLSASFYGESIHYHQNEGDGSFTTHVIDSNAIGATAVAAADIDDDGDIDLLSSSYHENTIFWYENDESGAFVQRHTIYDNAQSATAIAIADFDKDDDVDVLSASVGDDSSRWYENDLRTLSEAEEKILEATVVQYPNPTSDTLYLRYPSASNVDYGLFDCNGRFLGTYSKTGKEHRFDVSGLSKGMYFLKATSDGVTYDYYRFLVN